MFHPAVLNSVIQILFFNEFLLKIMGKDSQKDVPEQFSLFLILISIKIEKYKNMVRCLISLVSKLDIPTNFQEIAIAKQG